MKVLSMRSGYHFESSDWNSRDSWTLRVISFKFKMGFKLVTQRLHPLVDSEDYSLLQMSCGCGQHSAVCLTVSVALYSEKSKRFESSC